MPRILLNTLFVLIFIPTAFSQQKKVIVKPTQRQVSSIPFNMNVKDDPMPIKYIQLKKDTPVFVPKHFYIQKVEYKANTNDSIGYILQPKSGRKQTVAFLNGTVNAIQDYFNFKIAKDTTLYPLVLVLKEASLTEEKNTDVYRHGTFKYAYSFEYQSKSKPLSIGGENGSFSYTTHITQDRHLDSNITQALIFNLEDIDKNLGEAINNHPSFCKGVNTVVLTKINNDATNDTLFYDGQNDIMWDDFKGNPSGADNYFLPQISVLLSPTINYADGKFQLKINTGAYFIRSRSWVGKKIQTAALLYHIQYRLKLAWLEAKQLKKQLESTTFSCENYEAEVRDLFEKSNKELLHIFDEYINKTMSGANKSEQNRWQSLIDKQLEE